MRVSSIHSRIRHFVSVGELWRDGARYWDVGHLWVHSLDQGGSARVASAQAGEAWVYGYSLDILGCMVECA